MSQAEIVDALGPFLATFGAELTNEQWGQYHLALAGVNPGDLDDAMADLRRTHAFRNAPLPADILNRCEVHRKARAVPLPSGPVVKVDPNEGEWRTFTLKGIGSLRLHVLPDEHPALPRYACLRCKDTSWEEIPKRPDEPGQPTCRRCGCWATNPVIAQQRSKAAESRRTRA